MLFPLLQDTFFRYLKSPVYKDIQKKALNPEPHNFRLVADEVIQTPENNPPTAWCCLWVTCLKIIGCK